VQWVTSKMISISDHRRPHADRAGLIHLLVA